MEMQSVAVSPLWESVLCKHNEESSWEYLFCGWGVAAGQEPVTLCEGESFSVFPIFELTAGKSEMFTFSFVISWFMSSKVKPDAFSPSKLFVPRTMCCEVHRGAKMALKITYVLSASDLGLQKMTKIWNSCWCNPPTKEPILHLKGCFAFLHLKTQMACVCFSLSLAAVLKQPLNFPCWRGA